MIGVVVKVLKYFIRFRSQLSPGRTSLRQSSSLRVAVGARQPSYDPHAKERDTGHEDTGPHERGRFHGTL